MQNSLSELPSKSHCAMLHHLLSESPQRWPGNMRLQISRSRTTGSGAEQQHNPSDRSAPCLGNKTVRGEAHLKNINPTESFISCSLVFKHISYKQLFFFWTNFIGVEFHKAKKKKTMKTNSVCSGEYSGEQTGSCWLQLST